MTQVETQVTIAHELLRAMLGNPNVNAHDTEQNLELVVTYTDAIMEMFFFKERNTNEHRGNLSKGREKRCSV